MILFQMALSSFTVYLPSLISRLPLVYKIARDRADSVKARQPHSQIGHDQKINSF
jgi:hypothetical protein